MRRVLPHPRTLNPPCPASSQDSQSYSDSSAANSPKTRPLNLSASCRTNLAASRTPTTFVCEAMYLLESESVMNYPR